MRTGAFNIVKCRAATRARHWAMVVLLLIAAGSALADSPPSPWRKTYEEHDANGELTVEHFVHMPSLVWRRNGAEAWLLASSSTPHALTRDETFSSYKTLVRVDCRNHKITITREDSYAGVMGKGRLLLSRTTFPTNWRDPESSDWVARTAEAICAHSGVAYSPPAQAPVLATVQLPAGARTFARTLMISESRPEVLVVGVTQNRIPQEVGPTGLYLYSIADPRRLTLLGSFPIMNPVSVVLSADGLTAYVLSPRYGGFPTDASDYGVFIVDISDPRAPVLLRRIDGYFSAAGLSPSGDVLFLQESKQLAPAADAADNGIRVYDLKSGTSEASCIPAFRGGQGGPAYAYQFIPLSDTRMLLQAQDGTLQEYAMDEPCAPRFIRSAPNADGSYVAGFDAEILLGGVDGVASYAWSDPVNRWKGYRSKRWLWEIRASRASHAFVAWDFKDVLVFEWGEDGCFSAPRKYHATNLTQALVASPSLLIIGGLGWISAIALEPPLTRYTGKKGCLRPR